MSKECSKFSLVKSLPAECRVRITGMYVCMGAESVCCNTRVYHCVCVNHLLLDYVSAKPL